MRKKIVAGNWKMNLAAHEAVQLVTEIKQNLTAPACEVAVFPSFLYLQEIKRITDGSAIRTGAQNCSSKENGAFTGEISAGQLKSAGIEHVLIGHSERREYYGETNSIIKEKLTLALKHGLKPIFCCGEPLMVRQSKAQAAFVKTQLEDSLFGFSDKELRQVTIAYEPVWAIGTGLNATPEQAQEMHAFIRAQVKNQFYSAVSDSIRILYGGSCKPDNAKELFACPDVDGGLIGGASLKAQDFLAIIEAAK